MRLAPPGGASSTSAPNHVTSLLPVPTSIRAPTIRRTMCGRKAFASMSNNAVPSALCIRATVTTRSVRVRLASAGCVNAAKSCLPTRSSAASAIISRSRLDVTCETMLRISAGRCPPNWIVYRYQRLIACRRGSNRKGTSAAERRLISRGRRALVPRKNVSIACALAVTNAATCPLACTPASVRPARATLIGSFVKLLRACSSEPCTVGAFGWYCEPPYPVPSYSTRRARRRRPAAESSLLTFQADRTCHPKSPLSLLNQLELRHSRAIAETWPQLHHPAVPPRPACVARAELIKDLLYYLLIVDESHSPPAGV